MTDPRWQSTWKLFHQALEVEPSARERWLAEACGDDGELRLAVDRLLAGHAGAPSFLDRPQEMLGLFESGDELIGHTLGPYRLEQLLGEGGMGVVYRAVQELPIRRSVALKLVRPGMATREVLARFESERQALAVLDHPNIAQVFDAGATAAGQPYFVMELVEGVAISRYCDQQRLSTGQRLELFAAVCRAVHHAHQKGIIHRDLKPSNVLVTEVDGQPVAKVIDFGVARAVDRGRQEGTALTELGKLIGTPEYMSPEQRERLTDVDIRTDVYSLGVMLYELLVGDLPVEPSPRRSAPPPSKHLSGLGQRRQEIAAERRTHPAGLRQELRGDLDWIAMKALEEDRDQRYGSASEIAQEIGRYLRHEPVLAGPPTLAYRAGKLLRRHRLAATATAALLVLLLTFSLVTAWQSVELRRALAESEREARKAAEVSSFLTDLFAVADPAEAQGETVLAREILDRGAERLKTELHDQPEVRAAMMATVGEIYTHLGLFSESEELLGGSLELRHGLGKDHPDVADSHYRLAYLRFWQGDYSAAEAEARRALAGWTASFGDNSLEVAEGLRQLGTVLVEVGNFAEAEASLSRALELSRELAPDDSPRQAAIRNSLALVWMATGRFEEAAATWRQIIADGLSDLGPDHPNVHTRQLNLASVLSELGRDGESEELLREVLAARRRVFGDDHELVAVCMNNLGRVVQRLGNYVEAEALFLQALEMRRRLFAFDQMANAVTLLNLGVVMRQTGRYEEAERYYREALALEERLLGAEHPTVAIPHHNLATLLRRLGRLEEAEREMRRAVEILRGALGEDHPHVARSQAALGKIVLVAGRAAEAEVLLRDAEQVLAEALPAGHWRTLQARVYLGESLTAQKRFEQAEPLLTLATAALYEQRGAEDETVKDALASVARLYQAWGKPEQAEGYAESLSAVQLAED